ncbi:hypothetical protein HS1genome_0174 [Sulfodiicoccus acidiphilus]|uniref:ATPase n=1 Tax=Sulfodiicoccus acidiphilus TaxID=1670455 RepID=A0A348B0T3_9CREN|nr:hypothetical protein [Sulfodiicoccus acidiphilus]BBD71785.1 hypothetical protein HS1genome_0174 [Sulfodiicoccus acidiphilus]GGT99180.1 hypothetical protein GCM10007116_15670 [Sulfodiicoccus acidiphilus]
MGDYVDYVKKVLDEKKSDIVAQIEAEYRRILERKIKELERIKQESTV